MASNYSQINLGIKTTTDLTSINNLKKELRELVALTRDIDFTGGLDVNDINAVTQSAHTLERALNAAFDVDLDAVNIQKFNQYLQKSGVSLMDIQKGFNKAGVDGQKAFNHVMGEVLQLNTAVKQTNKFLDDIATSFGNTVRWSIMSGIVNNISSTIQQSYYYIKDLDSGLNDIRIVTGKSADEMERFAVEANNAAKALAVSTKDYTEGSLIYYQQGLDDKTVKTLTDITAMTSNVTGQSMETVSEQLTAVWNGYQVANQAAKEGMGVYQEYVDKMAAVGAATASDLEELATAMSKVASAANAMGVDFDQLSAQIATIVSVTRQAPESVGTALKTIYARIGDLKVDGVDEFGTTLGEVSSNLAKVGIEVVDTNGEMRDIGQVMEEVAAKWDTWNESQQQAIAISIAGKRQYNNLLALFENWDMYTDTLDTAANAAGTLNEQQEIALDSINNKMDILKATAEDLYDNLFDEQSIKDIIDILTGLLQSVADLVDNLGGLKTILPIIGSLGITVFSKQIGQGIATFSGNLRKSISSLNQVESDLATLKDLFPEVKFETEATQGQKDILNYYKETLKNKRYMTQEDQNIFNAIIKQKVAVEDLNAELKNQIQLWQSNKKGTAFAGSLKDLDVSKEQTEELRKVSNDYKQALNNLKQGAESGSLSNAQLLNKFIQELKDAGFETKELDNKIRNLAIDAGKVSNINLDELINEFDLTEKQVQDLLTKLEQYQNELEATKNAEKNLGEKLDMQKVSRGFTDLFGAFTQVIAMINTITNASEIWKDETLDVSEKLSKSLPALVTVLGMGASLWSQWNNGLKDSVKTVDLFFKQHPAISIITALVIAGVAAWATYQKIVNKNVEALKDIKEETKELKQEFDEATAKYEELLNTIEGSQNAEAAIARLTEGTIEWKKAIADANSKVLELLENYPELINYISENEDGLLSISQEGYDYVQGVEYEKVQEANRKYITSQTNKIKAQEIVDREEFNKKFDVDINYDEFIKDLNKTIVDNAKNNEKTFSDLVRETLEAQGQTVDNIDKLIKDDFVSEVYNLSQTIENNTKAIDLLNEQYAESFLDANLDSNTKDRFNRSQFKDTVTKMVKEEAEKAYDESVSQKETKEEQFYNALEPQNVAWAGITGGSDAIIAMQTAAAFDLLLTPDVNKTDEEIKTQAYSDVIETVNDKIEHLEDTYTTSVTELQNTTLSGTAVTELSQMMAKASGGDIDFSNMTQEQYDVVKDLSADELTSKYGVNENYSQQVVENIESWDAAAAESKRAAEEAEKFNQTIKNGATVLEVSEDALEGYANYLIETNEGLEENKELAAQAAIKSVQFAQGVDELKEVLDDNIDALEAWDESAFETYEASAKVQDALEKVFGVKVSSDFVHEYLKEIKELADGSTESLDKLQLAAAQDYVGGLGLAEAEIQTISDMLNDLTSQDLTIGMTAEMDHSYIEQFNKLLEDGKVTAEQAQAIFNTIGYNPDIKWKTIDNPNPPVSTYTTVIEEKGQEPRTITVTKTDHSKIAVPYIATEDTFAAGDKVTGNGAMNAGSGFTKTTTSGSLGGALQSASRDKSNASKKKKLEDEVDRYWELNKALEAVTETISDLDKRQSHLHGKELINSLKQENELLEEQANRYKAINAEQMREADELRQKLASTYAVSFDANGGIANYAEATTRMLNWYNSNLNDEVAQESYENFKKLLERYETLYYEEMVDVQNQLDDIFYQQLENNLKAWETDLEINLELEEAEREWSDFTKAMQDDFKKVYRDINRDFTNIMEKMSSYGDDGTINLDIQAIQDVVREIEKFESGGQSDMFASISEAQEKLKELQGTLMDDAEAVHDLWVEAWEAYLEGIDQAADKFDDLMEKFDIINEELEFQRELTELLYGDQAYGIYADIYAAQLNTTMKEIESLRQQADLWEQMYETAEEGSEEQLKYYELMTEAQSELNDKTLEYIKLSEEQYNNANQQIMNNLDKALTSGLGMDKVSEQWEQTKWYSDRYLDNLEQAYNLETLTNTFDKAIASASTLENQQELNAAKERELAILKEKKNISEYDIQLAEKRFSLQQAYQALEDAQNAKNAMKLVRGANGNWEYQYVANEDDIAEKQQNILDLEYEIINLSQKRKEQMISDVQEQYAAWEAESMAAAEKYKNDEEALQQALAAINDKYWNKDTGIISLLMQGYAQADKDLTLSMEQATNSSLESVRNMVSTVSKENLGIWTEMTQNMADMWNSDDGDSIRSQVQDATNNIINNAIDYQDTVDSVANAVGKDFSEEGIKGAIDDTTIATENLNNATQDLCTEAYSYLTDYKNMVDEIALAWNKVYESVTQAMKASNQSLDTSKVGTSNEPVNPSPSPSPGSGGDSSAGKGTPNAATGKFISEPAHYDASGKMDSQYPPQPTNAKMYLVDTQPGARYPYGIAKSPGSSRYGWVSAYDTGGYTGEWSGGDGRLAFLHSKELVLNAKDTENILDTVNTIRDLGNVTSSIGSAIVSTIKAMAMELLGIKAGANYNTQQANTSTNNTFEIYAEFPNANDVTSIREAILSLPNLASQYTSQNKK